MTTGRLTMKKLTDWIKPQLSSDAALLYDRMPDYGRVILIQPRSGLGLEMEGLYDSIVFAVNCRGAENNFEDAENIALDFDSVLLKNGQNIFMGDVHVQFVGRIGGSPSMLSIDDPQSRFTWSCSYYAVASTGL